MSRTYLVTGGAGFIGSNYACRLIRRKERVLILDNLSRRGARQNLAWLRATHGEHSFTLITGDIRNPDLLRSITEEVDVIVHLAAQVAVTTSIRSPIEDFEINAHGTLNLLEAARLSQREPIFLYASTNKVYGPLDAVSIDQTANRYRYTDLPLGIAETQALDFHSPYGCSKGAADQYVRDYNRIYGLPTVVLRQSCVYGPRQFGIEDQGWAAWFVIAALTQRPITIFGDGRQVRDLLWVDDLLNCYDQAVERIVSVAGQAYNIGGGPQNTIAVWQELGPLLARVLGREVPVTYRPTRPGDQRIFVSDIRRAAHELGWLPEVGVEEGLGRLIQWVRSNLGLMD